MQRRGMYPAPTGASDILGLEVAGEVVAAGDAVTGLAIGDDVCALVTGGGDAEYCPASESLCLPIPTGVTAIEAATLPETHFTVWSNVFQRAHMQPGERLLVHGGGGGIGTTAIQLAHAFGSVVYTTAGSEEKCAAARELGADAAINYREQDFVEKIKTLTDGRGVDVILDILGGDYFARNISCLATEGRLVQIAVQRGPKTDINLVRFMLKRLTLTGSTLRPRSVADKALIAADLRERVWPKFATGELRPLVHQSFPLAEAAAAHASMEASSHIGKIALTMG
jgi:putative PIG3 family NAD(P)H quinone oxidoreductase